MYQPPGTGVKLGVGETVGVLVGIGVLVGPPRVGVGVEVGTGVKVGGIPMQFVELTMIDLVADQADWLLKLSRERTWK